MTLAGQKFDDNKRSISKCCLSTFSFSNLALAILVSAKSALAHLAARLQLWEIQLCKLAGVALTNQVLADLASAQLALANVVVAHLAAKLQQLKPNGLKLQLLT